MEPTRTYSADAVRRRRRLGASGEQAAARAYLQAGYEVLDRNWRCRDGELDLIVARGHQVVFCEVKSRSSDAYGPPAAAVTPAKRRRIRHLAMRWLDEHGTHGRVLRFDVAAVLDGVVEIIEDAF